MVSESIHGSSTRGKGTSNKYKLKDFSCLLRVGPSFWIKRASFIQIESVSRISNQARLRNHKN